MSQLQIGRVFFPENEDTDRSVQEIASEVGRNFQYGTDAPTTETQGQFYFKVGASATDTVTVYVNVNGVWYGG